MSAPLSQGCVGRSFAAHIFKERTVLGATVALSPHLISGACKKTTANRRI